MTVLTICNHKGGTGKTTSTVHIAAALGLIGYRVLVVDLDPQGFLTRTVGLSEPAEEASALMLFRHDVELRDVPREKLPGFDVLPSSTGLTRAMRQLNKPTDVLWTREALQTLEGGYDVVLFDTAAAVTVFSLNALVASRHVIIPVTPEYQPVIGAEQTYVTVSMVQQRLNPELATPYFLFTQVDARKRNHHKYRQYFRRKYGDQVLETVIRTSASLASTHADGTTVFVHAPSSRGARDYANVTDELIQTLGLSQPPLDVPNQDDAEEEDATEAHQSTPAPVTAVAEDMRTSTDL